MMMPMTADPNMMTDPLSNGIKMYDLMSSNVGRARGYRRILLVSSCIARDRPSILENIVDPQTFVVYACPEAIHINHIGYKLISFLVYSDIGELWVLSVDGSYHCIQLQYLAEDIKRNFIRELEVRHLVFAGGRIHEINPKIVKASRFLSKLQRVISVDG